VAAIGYAADGKAQALPPLRATRGPMQALADFLPAIQNFHSNDLMIGRIRSECRFLSIYIGARDRYLLSGVITITALGLVVTIR